MRSSLEVFRILNYQFHVLYAFTVADARQRQQGQLRHQKGVVGVMILSLRQAEGDVPSSFAGGPPSHSQLGGAN